MFDYKNFNPDETYSIVYNISDKDDGVNIVGIKPVKATLPREGAAYVHMSLVINPRQFNKYLEKRVVTDDMKNSFRNHLIAEITLVLDEVMLRYRLANFLE